MQEAFAGFGQNLIITLINLAFLPHQMLMALDAIIRSLVRRFITGQRLLEWETAAQAESTGGDRTTPVDRYLQATPIFTIGVALLIAAVHKQSLVVAAPLLVLWLFESGITAWLKCSTAGGPAAADSEAAGVSCARWRCAPGASSTSMAERHTTIWCRTTWRSTSCLRRRASRRPTSACC